MDSRLSLLVLLVLVGCGPKACGRPSPGAQAGGLDASVGSAPAAAEPPEARLAGKHFVIVHASPIPGEGEAVLERLRAAGLGAEAQRLSSTPFSALRPCLEVVVAGALSDGEAARGLVQRLSAAGVKSYLKNAGPLASDRAQREADCRLQAEVLKAPPRVGASGPRFLDLRGERTFVLLSEGPQDTPGAPLRQVGEDRGFWMAALQEDPTGTFKRGDGFEVYDAQGPIKVDCRVKGFASLNRGIPHFSYFQQSEAPESPGCGKAWPVAELDCSLMNTRARESNLAFVLPRGSPAPRYLPPSAPGAAEAERTLAMLDLEGDGRAERLTRAAGDPSQVALVREDGSRVTATFLPQCDPNP